MILKPLWTFLMLFCLTIGQTYAEEVSSIDQAMPSLIIDLSSIATHVWLTQAQVWGVCSLFSFVLAVFMWILLNKNPHKAEYNQGDAVVKKVSILWMAMTMLLMVGFAIPLLRIWLFLG